MRIKQCYLSLPLRGGMHENFLRYHNLKPYHTRGLPAIFFGFYNDLDVRRISKHKTMVVLVWRGSDVFRRG